MCCTEHGVFIMRAGFEVVVCSHFHVDDFGGFLEGALPMDKLQPIAPYTSDE